MLGSESCKQLHTAHQLLLLQLRPRPLHTGSSEKPPMHWSLSCSLKWHSCKRLQQTAMPTQLLR